MSPYTNINTNSGFLSGNILNSLMPDMGSSGVLTSPDGSWNYSSGGGTNYMDTGNNYVDTSGITDLNSGGGTLDGLAKFFGGDTFKGLLGVGQLLGQGLQAFNGFNQYNLGKQAIGLAKNQFNFQKGLANRNLANQASQINAAYDNAAQVAAGMVGVRNADGSIGDTDRATIDRYEKSAKEKHVDGSPIN